jgi:hypothetical protein
MPTTIERRVAQLEAATDGGDRCPVCGNGPDDDKRPHEIVFVDPGKAPPDEWCPACGRALSLTINMDWGN